MATINPSPSPDTPITIKIALNNGENKRFKLALRDLGAISLPDKLRHLLAIPATQDVLFERFSDSAGTYITLDSNNPSVYKQLYRAAKAKLKLRIKVTVADAPSAKPEMAQPELSSAEGLTSHRYTPPMCADALKTAITVSSTATNVNSSPVPTHSAPAKPRVDLLGTKTQRLRYAYATNSQNEMAKKFSKCRAANVEAPKASPEEVAAPGPDATKDASKAVADDEAPVPGFFSTREHFYAELASIGRDQPTLLRSADQEFPVPGTTFTICCNNCDGAIPDAHWHCSICDDGDFDLCAPCVEKGVLCDTTDHWLIKRFVRDGKVINSTTETIAPKATKVESEKEVPGAFASETKQEEFDESIVESRTCNSCVQVFNEANFVTCTVCDDYDLCIPCHVTLKHGHHPSHTLEPASKETTLDTMATNLCAPGRNMRHFAICDGCDKDIYGVRHKCMNCPDWDYCSTCVKSARDNHPGHHFVPLYEPIQTCPAQRSQRHYGINCDGPLCKGKGRQTYIVGDRYKCAVCHDTDFCANCEALPTHRHNRTHPLIKFKSPVKSVSVTTVGEKENGEQYYIMGDHVPQTSSKSTETTPAAKSANAATQVQTIAELKPTEPIKEEAKTEAIKVEPTKVGSVSVGSVRVEPVKVELAKVEPAKVEPTKVEPAKTPAVSELQAQFVRDTIVDGSVLPPGVQFEQVWTLRNPGPHAWPAGCSVRFVGGTAMFNVDSNHPSSSSDIYRATESNVIRRAVKVGEEVDFAVLMRTPEHEGKRISFWRLKAPEGVPFGHRLWCDVTVCAPKLSSPVPETKHIEDLAKMDNNNWSKAESQNRMIFPKLDKESPVSSTHEAAIPPVAMPTEERELLEDVENLGLNDDETDDGFLTDEEYEMLNASDEEWMEARNGKK